MSIKDIILDSYVNRVGVTREVAAANMDKFSYNVSGVESNYGTNLINKDGSSARGIYQFLTKGDANAYQTGLNRLSNAYKKAGKKAPTWITQARKDNDPIKLTNDRQEEVMLANIYQQSTSDLTGMLEGNQQSGMDLYLEYHHTDATDVPTANRALDFFKPAPVQQEQVVTDVNASALDPELPQQSSHTVVANDTLYNIAKRSGMSVEDLQTINPEVTDHTNLQLGQQLKVGNGWFEQL